MNQSLFQRDCQRQQIGIAVIEHEGSFLVGIRSEQSHLSGKAEFPGGKCEPGETSAACAIRECLEETGLRVDIDQLLCEREFDYPHSRLRLSFYLCRLVDLAVAPSVGWNWIPCQKLMDLDFPEANAPVIEMLLDRHSHGNNLLG